MEKILNMHSGHYALMFEEEIMKSFVANFIFCGNIEKVGWKLLLQVHREVSWESVSKRVWKIGQKLHELRPEINGLFLLEHNVCIVYLVAVAESKRVT